MNYILSEEEYNAIVHKAEEKVGNKIRDNLYGLLEPETVSVAKSHLMDCGDKLMVVYDTSMLDEFVVSKLIERISRY